MLRNSGTCTGRFSINVEPPFSVTPSDGSLAVGEGMQLVFGFRPEGLGDVRPIPNPILTLTPTLALTLTLTLTMTLTLTLARRPGRVRLEGSC